MRKYNNFVDNVQVKRNEFFKELRNWSQTARRVDTINGWCGVDIMEFDEKQYEDHMKCIRSGIGIIIMNGNACKQFQRKAV
jgi:hypothetical protein